MRTNSGSYENKAFDLFSALWIPDLFMRRVEKDEDWSLFCPAKAPGLADVWGDDFDELYTSYEKAGVFNRKVPARQLWSRIVDTATETGLPYIQFKDAVNRKTNQSNLGTIMSSNL